MKRYLRIGLGLVILAIIVWAGIFYWKNLRGVTSADILVKDGSFAFVTDDKAGVIYKINANV